MQQGLIPAKLSSKREGDSLKEACIPGIVMKYPTTTFMIGARSSLDV